MAYRTAHRIDPHLGSGFARLKPAFEALGARVDSPSGDGYLTRVSINGFNLVFSNEGLPINSSSSHLLARDKLATYQLLEDNGVRVPTGMPFFDLHHRGRPPRVDRRLLLPNLEASLKERFRDLSADALYVVKPSRESHAYGVHLCRGVQAVLEAAREVLEYNRCGIVQEFVSGAEYRVVMLDDDVLVTYRKHNPALIGDGHSTEQQLIDKFNENLQQTPEDPPVLDKGCLPPLHENRTWDLDRIPPKGEILELALETQNLNQGAWPEVLEDVPGDILEIAYRAHRLLGLHYSGIDLRLPDGQANAVVLEVNGNPGFLFLEHYAPELVAGIAERVAARIVNSMKIASRSARRAASNGCS